MKKYITLFFVFILVISMCSCGTKNTDSETEHGPYDVPEQTEIKGTYYRVNKNLNLVVSTTGEPIIFTIGSWSSEPETLNNGDTIIFVCDGIEETYPARTVAELLTKSDEILYIDNINEVIANLANMGYN